MERVTAAAQDVLPEFRKMTFIILDVLVEYPGVLNKHSVKSFQLLERFNDLDKVLMGEKEDPRAED